jgi:hypothetical protein
MPLAHTPQASRPTATVVQLKVPRRYHAPEDTPRPTTDEMHSACGGSGNFCRCWMPAWFRLAELVGQERRSANVES